MPTDATDATPRGMALVMVMLLTVGVAALAAAAIFLSSGASLISRGQEREEDMRNAADAGIELGRSALNGNPATLPGHGLRDAADQPAGDRRRRERDPGRDAQHLLRSDRLRRRASTASSAASSR